VPVVNANASICQGDSIQLGGAWQTTAGIYTDIYQAANGCDSIRNTTLTIVAPTTGSQSLTICNGDSIFVGGAWQFTAGSYVDNIIAASGCDSILTTNLAVYQVDTSVTVQNNILTAGASGAAYVWLNCVGNTPVPGATAQVFAPTVNGLYSVVVTQNGCADTSTCWAITTIGIKDFEIPSLSYSPNPTTGLVNINLGARYKRVTVSVVSSSGQMVSKFSFSRTDNAQIDLSELPAATYFLQIDADDKREIVKIVVQ
jgi:hypothetical protein